ncbi:protein kilB [Kitasatospora sp. NPDC058397]|uniref:protein kilB n=1 Tax=unclassified Kitasatospora TaxID=2633591 RepID=UPI00364ED967
MTADGVLTTLVAVLGTLLGTLGAGYMQQRAARAERAEARRESREQARVQALRDLVTALDAHRRAMWLREKIRLADPDAADRNGARAARYDEARTASHLTRAAITGPLVTLSVLAPALAGLANDAAEASYAMRNAPDPDVLAAARNSAVAAVMSLVAAAGEQLA